MTVTCFWMKNLDFRLEFFYGFYVWVFLLLNCFPNEAYCKFSKENLQSLVCLLVWFIYFFLHHMNVCESSTCFMYIGNCRCLHVMVVSAPFNNNWAGQVQRPVIFFLVFCACTLWINIVDKLMGDEGRYARKAAIVLAFTALRSVMICLS